MQAPSKEAALDRQSACGQSLSSAVKLASRHPFAHICKRFRHQAYLVCSRLPHIPVQHHRASFWNTALLPPRLTQNRKRLSFNLKHKLLRSSQDPASSKGAATASAAPGLSSTYAGPALAKALQATLACSSCQATFASASWKWIHLEYPKKRWVRLCVGLQLLRLLRRAMCQHQPNGCCHAQRPTHGVGHIQSDRSRKLLDTLEPSLALADQPHLLNAGIKQRMRA